MIAGTTIPEQAVEAALRAWLSSNHDEEIRISMRRAVEAALPHTGQPQEGWPIDLHENSKRLVADFAAALAQKLRAAEVKYGYQDGWLNDEWEDECRSHLYEHLAKGDPRDVAVYCAFMWIHKWSTAAPPPPVAESGWQEIETAMTTLIAMFQDTFGWTDNDAHQAWRFLESLAIRRSLPAPPHIAEKRPEGK